MRQVQPLLTRTNGALLKSDRDVSVFAVIHDFTLTNSVASPSESIDE